MDFARLRAGYERGAEIEKFSRRFSFQFCLLFFSLFLKGSAKDAVRRYSIDAENGIRRRKYRRRDLWEYESKNVSCAFPHLDRELRLDRPI